MTHWRRSQRRCGRVRAVGIALILALCFGGSSSQAREVYGLSGSELGLYLGNSLLSSWRVPEARAVVDRLMAQDAEDAQARALDAHVLFFEGRYRGSLERLDALGIGGPFRELVAATVEATRNFQSVASKHFEIFWGDPKDEIMVQPALEALEASRAALANYLGFEPTGRVRVEIYATAADFTAVSTLTRKEVATSGTIGLCKFDRLMITSPRATLWGYGWRDTLCHEYVHLALYRMSEGTAPIWVHEGIAKYLEGSWRGAYGELDPSAQALLARRLDEGTLIPLDEMSPSVAKLPSAEDTSLAFAEVGTMMAYLVEVRGPAALRRMVEAIGEGMGDREALELIWQDSFASFDASWRKWVRGLPLQRKAAQIIGLELAEGREVEEHPGTIPDPQARDFSRLGDLLRERGRMAAAAIEYAKAFDEAPEAPGIASRYALTLLYGERFAEALAVAEAALELYPDLAVLWYRKGEALLGLEQYADALDALREILEINPFHIPARRGMLMAARELGDQEEADRQEWALALLEGNPY